MAPVTNVSPQMPFASSNSKHIAECQTTEVEEAYHKVYHGIVRRLWNKRAARSYLSEGFLMNCSDWFWEGPATE
jgi:hypothetical protein